MKSRQDLQVKILEDILYIVNNRTVIADEIRMASREVKEYVIDEFNALLEAIDIDEILAAHITEQGRTSLVKQKIHRITGR